ncbi:MAG: VWA domain-containing protein [Actinomycetes bacterium]
MWFLEPFFLLALIAIAALVACYVLLQQRRRHYAVRFTNIELLSSVAPKRPGWRRHVPAAVVGVALVLLVLGLAQPVHDTQVAGESKIVMLAIDVSKSMEATDVAPTRLQAEQKAAVEFVQELPADYEVGLVTFSDTAQVVVPPTTNHQQVTSAINALQPEASTATGDAIIASLRAIAVARAAAGVQPQDSGQTGGKSATIILLSDGDRKTGVSLETASAAAVKAGVPVSTITFGTATGTVLAPDGTLIPVPPDPQAMAAVAKATGGRAFDAASAAELRDVYSQIQGDVGYKSEQSDLWPWFLGIALLMLMAACVAAMFWSARFL